RAHRVRARLFGRSVPRREQACARGFDGTSASRSCAGTQAAAGAERRVASHHGDLARLAKPRAERSNERTHSLLSRIRQPNGNSIMSRLVRSHGLTRKLLLAAAGVAFVGLVVPSRSPVRASSMASAEASFQDPYGGGQETPLPEPVVPFSPEELEAMSRR